MAGLARPIFAHKQNEGIAVMSESSFRVQKEERKGKKEDPRVLEAREAYKAKFGKDVAVAFKNNVEWMDSKINEVN